MLNKLLMGLLLVCSSGAASADTKVFDMSEIESRTAASRTESPGGTPAANVAASIAEADMSVETLERLFKNAYFKTEVAGEDSLMVHMSDGLTAKIHIDRQHKLLCFYKVYGFKDRADMLKRLELANQINDDVIVVRASVPEDHPDRLVFDYNLSYEDAVLAYQIVNGIRHFADISTKAVNKYDTGDIVE